MPADNVSYRPGLGARSYHDKTSRGDRGATPRACLTGVFPVRAATVMIIPEPEARAVIGSGAVQAGFFAGW
jgi:hypothetical protein